jgi:hypothetical protein
MRRVLRVLHAHVRLQQLDPFGLRLRHVLQLVLPEELHDAVQRL